MKFHSFSELYLAQRAKAMVYTHLSIEEFDKKIDSRYNKKQIFNLKGHL